jgi:hypothetical protein
LNQGIADAHESAPTTTSDGRPSDERWARTRRTVARHWPFLIVLAVGLALRVVAQVAYRPALLSIDSYRYLDLVRTTNPAKSQTLGYVFFLWPLVKVGNLFVVAFAQHAIGLGIAVAIYLLCMRYGVSRWLATLATVPILLDAYQLQIEQNIMSETLFEALLVGGLLALLWNRRPSTRALVIGGLLLGLSVPVRVVALPVVVPAMIFAFVCGPGGWRRLARAAIVAIAFLLPVVAYIGYYRSQAGDWGLTTSDARALYGRAAQIVDCSSLELPSYERPLCPKEPLGKRIGIDYYAHTYPVADLVTVPPGQTLNDVVRDFSRRVFKHQPLDLIHGVAIDFLKGFRWDRTNARGDVAVERWQFQKHWPYYQYDPKAATERWGGGSPTVLEPLASFLRAYQLSVGYTPGPVLLLAFLGGVLAGCGVYRARRSNLRAVCWLPTLAGLLVLLGADVFEFSWRYQLPMLVFAPIAGALGFTAIFRNPDTRYPAASSVGFESTAGRVAQSGEPVEPS